MTLVMVKFDILGDARLWWGSRRSRRNDYTHYQYPLEPIMAKEAIMRRTPTTMLAPLPAQQATLDDSQMTH